MNIPEFKAVRRAAVPLCAIETSDPAQTIRECCKLALAQAKANDKGEMPVCEWDLMRGITGINASGKEFATNASPEGMISTGNPTDCLAKLTEAPKDLILFMHNAHRILEDATVCQGIWNLRDIFKGKHCTLVLMAPNIVMPPQLQQDVMIFTEKLPDEKELSEIMDKVLKSAAGAKAPDPEDRPVLIDTLRGLSAFSAEQTIAISIRKTGIDREDLWTRKRKLIEQTPGLKLWRGGETFSDLGGLTNIKRYLTAILTSGKTPVRALGFVDEIEKGLAGAAGDTSGTSQDQLQVFLTVMQDLEIPGIILLGPPGTGKSAIAKGAGNVCSAPVVAIDTGAMKNSRVGESEASIRRAMEVFKAISQGKGLFIATCNKISSLPPELRRRFSLGTFFVDLPGADERPAIWKYWAKRYGIDAAEDLGFSDNGWTGAEIKACCDVSFRTGMPLLASSKYIVPVCKSAADQIQALRTLANGKFLCANREGVYDMAHKPEEETGRAIELE